MTNASIDIAELEADLWETADNLGANSKLTSSDYFIEPDHGMVFDPACGSGGMFVQSSHFIEYEGKYTAKAVVFFGQEKNRDTIFTQPETNTLADRIYDYVWARTTAEPAWMAA